MTIEEVTRFKVGDREFKTRVSAERCVIDRMATEHIAQYFVTRFSNPFHCVANAEFPACAGLRKSNSSSPNRPPPCSMWRGSR